jgi:hypothetical protein
VDRFHGECGQAHCDVFGSAVFRGRIAHPLACMSHDCLSGMNVERPALVLDSQRSLQNDGELIELGSLPGLEPSLGAVHVGDTGSGRFGIHSSDIFVDDFWFVSGRLNARRLRDESRHGFRLRRPQIREYGIPRLQQI